MTRFLGKISLYATLFVMCSVVMMLQTSNDAFAETSVPQWAQNIEKTTSEPVESDSVGDIHIRATFDMSNGSFENNSFKIFTQVSGYKDLTKTKYQKAVFTTAGAPGWENMWLYHAADVQHRGYQKAIDPSPEFNVMVEMYQGDTVFRSFDYTDCVVSNYYVSTLHDGDETFSGKTKFVYADNFEFTCSGMVLDCPFHSIAIDKAQNESTMDRQAKEHSSWGQNFR